jgi:hypothetical protein
MGFEGEEGGRMLAVSSSGRVLLICVEYGVCSEGSKVDAVPKGGGSIDIVSRVFSLEWNNPASAPVYNRMSRGGTWLGVGDHDLRNATRDAHQPVLARLDDRRRRRGFHFRGYGEQDFVAGEVIAVVVVEEQQRRSGCHCRSGLRLCPSQSVDGRERMDARTHLWRHGSEVVCAIPLGWNGIRMHQHPLDDRRCRRGFRCRECEELDLVAGEVIVVTSSRSGRDVVAGVSCACTLVGRSVDANGHPLLASRRGCLGGAARGGATARAQDREDARKVVLSKRLTSRLPTADHVSVSVRTEGGARAVLGEPGDDSAGVTRMWGTERDVPQMTTTTGT